MHLINPSDTAFGTAVITPRWLYVLAAATPALFGDPVLCDETLQHWDPAGVQTGDVVGNRDSHGQRLARLAGASA